jgi:transcriptional regulator with XRE-family HTH domain
MTTSESNCAKPDGADLPADPPKAGRPAKNEFSKRFLQALAERRLRATDIHRQLGYAHSTISRWSSGSVPNRRTVMDLSLLLNVSADWLLGKSESNTAGLRLPPSAPHISTVNAPSTAALLHKQIMDCHSLMVGLVEAYVAAGVKAGNSLTGRRAAALLPTLKAQEGLLVGIAPNAHSHSCYPEQTEPPA